MARKDGRPRWLARASQPPQRTYRVIYAMDLDAEGPLEAAEKLRDLLSDPDVPQRGSYIVVDSVTNESEVIDFGEEFF